MIYGGEALGRHEGKAIFVRSGLPRELVRIVVEENQTRVARERTVELVEPSPVQITPCCLHFGCDPNARGRSQWLHIDYAAPL